MVVCAQLQINHHL